MKILRLFWSHFPRIFFAIYTDISQPKTVVVGCKIQETYSGIQHLSTSEHLDVILQCLGSINNKFDCVQQVAFCKFMTVF